MVASPHICCDKYIATVLQKAARVGSCRMHQVTNVTTGINPTGKSAVSRRNVKIPATPRLLTPLTLTKPLNSSIRSIYRGAASGDKCATEKLIIRISDARAPGEAPSELLPWRLYNARFRTETIRSDPARSRPACVREDGVRAA